MEKAIKSNQPIMKQILSILLFLCTSTILLAQRNCPSVIDLGQMQTQDPARY